MPGIRPWALLADAAGCGAGGACPAPCPPHAPLLRSAYLPAPNPPVSTEWTWMLLCPCLSLGFATMQCDCAEKMYTMYTVHVLGRCGWLWGRRHALFIHPLLGRLPQQLLIHTTLDAHLMLHVLTPLDQASENCRHVLGPWSEHLHQVVALE